MQANHLILCSSVPVPGTEQTVKLYNILQYFIESLRYFKDNLDYRQYLLYATPE